MQGVLRLFVLIALVAQFVGCSSHSSPTAETKEQAAAANVEFALPDDGPGWPPGLEALGDSPRVAKAKKSFPQLFRRGMALGSHVHAKAWIEPGTKFARGLQLDYDGPGDLASAVVHWPAPIDARWGKGCARMWLQPGRRMRAIAADPTPLEADAGCPRAQPVPTNRLYLEPYLPASEVLSTKSPRLGFEHSRPFIGATRGQLKHHLSARLGSESVLLPAFGSAESPVTVELAFVDDTVQRYSLNLTAPEWASIDRGAIYKAKWGAPIKGKSPDTYRAGDLEVEVNGTLLSVRSIEHCPKPTPDQEALSIKQLQDRFCAEQAKAPVAGATQECGKHPTGLMQVRTRREGSCELAYFSVAALKRECGPATIEAHEVAHDCCDGHCPARANAWMVRFQAALGRKDLAAVRGFIPKDGALAVSAPCAGTEKEPCKAQPVELTRSTPGALLFRTLHDQSAADPFTCFANDAALQSEAPADPKARGGDAWPEHASAICQARGASAPADYEWSGDAQALYLSKLSFLAR